MKRATRALIRDAAAGSPARALARMKARRDRMARYEGIWRVVNDKPLQTDAERILRELRVGFRSWAGLIRITKTSFELWFGPDGRFVRKVRV